VTSTAVRRLGQIAVAVVLAGAVILVTEWAYPAGHLSVRLGRPYYSRAVGEAASYVTIDITLQNVGAEPVTIDREHFLLIDDTGRAWSSDPSTHFLRNHFDVLQIPAGYTIRGATVFKITPGRRAATMLFVTPTGQFVQLRLP
jgi:hypothetical protein